MITNKRIVVGMSGGVDSSASAAILKEQGYDVLGVTMKLWDKEQDGGCCSFSAIDDAKRVCEELGIKHYVADLRNEFRKYVVDYFISEYKQGRTPNPCVMCNKHIKFHFLCKLADDMDAGYISTGHYAKIENINGKKLLVRPKDKLKDQTYFLYNMTNEQVERTVFPLFGVTKDTTREIARKLGVFVSEKPDSQDICFIPDGDYKSFIKRQSGECKSGNFVDRNGNILGKHSGISNYTVGQRKGLGVTFNKPMYVTKIDASKNEVELGCFDEQFSMGLFAHSINLISVGKIEKPFLCTAKIRYNSHDVPCVVYPDRDGFKVEFKEEQKSVTSGQAVVLYDDNIVIGGGIIGDRF